MADLNREQLEQALAEYEEHSDDPEAWEEDTPANEPKSEPKRRLATQVTVRLEPELAEKLREIAASAGVGYTSLIREWIEERLRDDGRRTPLVGRVQYSLGSAGGGTAQVSVQWTQRSGSRAEQVA